MSANPEEIQRVPVSLPTWLELNRRTSLLSQEVIDALVAINGRVTTSFRGVWDQVADNSPQLAGPLDDAANYTNGDYYTCSVSGVATDLNGQKPELVGQNLGTGDQVIALDGVWLTLAFSTDFLSSVVDDTAAGLITFSVSAPHCPVTPSAADDLTRKGYVDGQDTAHANQTASGNDVHGAKTYTDNQDAAHAALTATTNDVHGTKTYADTQDAAHVAAVDPHGDRAYSDGQLSAHTSDADIHYPDVPSDGVPYVRVNKAWAEMPPSSAGLGAWTWAGVGIGFATGPGTFRSGSADYSAATEFRFNRFNGDTVDVSAALLFSDVGDYLYFQNSRDATSAGLYRLTEAPTQDPGGDVIFQNLAVEDGAGTMAGPVTFTALTSIGSHQEATDPHPQYLLKTDALAVFAFAAYGGMIVDTDAAFSNLGGSYQVIDVFDEVYPATPRGVTVSLPASTLAFENDGVYAFAITGTFEHNSSNQGRTTNIRVWNVTDGAQLGAPWVIGTGRNAEATPIAFVGLTEIVESNKNKEFRLEIGGGDTYSSVSFNALVFQVWNVGEWREPLPSE